MSQICYHPVKIFVFSFLTLIKKLKIWTESIQEIGAVNFITGAGGFLQIFLFGYAGLRLNVENLKFNGYYPLPPDSSYLYLHHIKYLGYTFNFNFTLVNIKLEVVKASVEYNLVLVTENALIDLRGNF